MITNPQCLVEKVNKYLVMNEEEAKSLIGSTTVTAYRRIHEVIASVLDRVVTLKALRSDDKVTFQKILQELRVELSRAHVLIKYQQAREQLSKGLAMELVSLVRTTSNILGESLDKLSKEAQNYDDIVENVVNALIRVRTLLDALTTLVYMYGKKHGKRE
ncbi:MAG: hypothetical protein QXY26_09565 [Ignisphaera sp.]